MSDIDLWPYVLPLRRPWNTSHGRATVRRGFILRVGDSFGEAASLPGASALELERIHGQLLRPRAAGRNSPRGPARHGLLEAALSETARRGGVSLGTLLGERVGRRPTPTIASNATLPLLRSVSATVQEARTLARQGFKTLKLKIGPRASEVVRIGAVRDALGPRIAIRLDANGAWDAQTAAKRLEALEPLGIQFVEQPISAGRPQQFLALAARSPIPIAPDEDIAHIEALRPFLENGVIEFVVLKPMVLGGPDLALDTVIRVEDAGATPVITDVVESSIGRAAAVHVASLARNNSVAHGVGSGGYLKKDLASPPLVPKRGFVPTPQSAGLGIHVRSPAA
jgi:L-Ala-D/L-Glu epimerase